MFKRNEGTRWLVGWRSRLFAALAVLGLSAVFAPPALGATFTQGTGDCQTSQVAGATVDEGAAAGTEVIKIKVTNIGSTDCSLRGYAVVFAFIAGSHGRSGHTVGAAATDQPAAPAAQTVVLAPHAWAHSWLEISSGALYPTSGCRPTPYRNLLWQAPNQGVAKVLALPASYLACANDTVHTMEVWPVQKGVGGTALGS